VGDLYSDGKRLTGVEALAPGIPIGLDDVTSLTQLDGATHWPLDTLMLGRDITGHALDDPRATDTARGITRVAVARGHALGCIGAQG